MTTEEWNDKPTGEGGSWLRPCPFCGYNATMSDLTDEDDRRHWSRTVRCSGCGAEVKEGIGWSQYRGLMLIPGEASAVVGRLAAGVWNTRTPEPVADEALERILSDARQVREFLSGEGPLDGLWFGDSGGGTAFWWRAHLKAFDALHGALSALARGKDSE